MKLIAELKTFFLSDTFRSLAMVVLMLLSAFDLFARRAAVNEINANINRFSLSRLMLNSRAQVQIILIKATLEDRKLNAEEVDAIGRLWNAADYSRAYEAIEEGKP